MVKITDGKKVITVTNGAYKTIYKKIGWVVADNDQIDSDEFEDGMKNSNIENEYESSDNDQNRSDNDTRNLNEKPLNEMSTDELFEYGLQIGADVNEDMTRKEIRLTIKAKLSE